ncbi:MAG TPA: pseudouridine synthase [Pirellulales bacterium]|jgi:23S rRNA pseudouridine2605 synthase|nr:pseudouridine synthase [Pirellulales bacterium]
MRRPSSTPRTKPTPSEGQGLARLQKILAAAGVGSRRQCEEVILEGRVEVDRKVVSQLGAKADPFRQEIRLDGALLAKPKRVYYLVHKPPGVLSTNRDPAGRPRVVDLLAPRGERLFTVGRLDMSSEGLILATNDGELANLLTHPRYGVEKTYHVEVAGAIDRAELARLEEGMYLAEGFARVVGARIKSRFKKSTLLEITLDEGRNREIRRLLARTGHKVMRLRRIALGPLRLGEVPSGAYRPLTGDEVRALWQTTTPAARREREQIQRAHAANKAKAAGNSTSTSATIDGDATPATSGNGAAGEPAKKHDERSARRGAKPAARRTSTAADTDEPVQFRLPRNREFGGDEPRRPVIIGGDSSSFGPRRSKPSGQVKPERPSQVSRPPKIGAATHPLDEPAEDVDATGAAPAKRPAKERWTGSGGRKAGSRPTGVGRRKAAARGKAGGRVKAAGRAKHAPPPKKTGRVKRRGAGRGESA